MANRKGKIKLKNGDVLYPETSWDKVTGRPSSLPADGGNSNTVNNHTVNSDVPANAKFTDTTYSAVSKTAAGLCPALPNETATTKYLRQDGTWQVPPNTTYSVATTSANGLMSSADKTKLNGIAEGANNYTHPTSHPATMITGLATVATSGKYSDLSGKPTIPAADDHKVHIGDASKNTIYKLAYLDSDATGNVYLYKELSSGLYVLTDPSDASDYAGLKFCCKGTIEASSINIDGSAVATQDWVTDRGYITGITKSMVTSALGYTPPATDTNTWKANSSSSEGYVASGAGKANKVWKTDANGNPAWRDDANTTYSNATTSAAGLMSSTDKSKLDGIASGANNYTHPASHPASMITGLATVATSGSYNDLSNKPTIPTVPGYGTSAAKIGTSSAGSAATVSRSDHVHAIDLATGDSNGQVKIAGTNVSVKGLGSAAYTASTAYASSSHTHSNADLTGIADWAKASSKPSYNFSEIGSRGEAYLVWGGRNLAGSYGPIDAAMVPELGANRLAFMPSASVFVEYSRDGGSTWTDYGLSDNNKINLFNGVGAGITIGKADSNNKATNQYQVRVRILTGTANVYTVLNKFVIYVSTNGTGNNWCTIRARTETNRKNNVDTWSMFATKATVAGWSGYNVINTPDLTTYGNTPDGQYGEIQFIFGCDIGTTSQYVGLSISKIFGFGGVGWTTPSTMAKTGHMYAYDAAKNVSFPANVSATSFTASNGTNSGTIKPVTGAYGSFRIEGAKGNWYGIEYPNNLRLMTENTFYGGYNASSKWSFIIKNINDTAGKSTLYVHELAGQYDTSSGANLNIGASSSLRPTTTETTNLGDSAHVWNNAYIKTIYENGTALSSKYLGINAKASSAGNADTVNGLTVQTAVPANAVFTDHTYSAVSKTTAGLCPALPNETATAKYLRQDGTWQVPPNTTYSVATTSANGLMSSSDKTKLNGIAEGANNYTHPATHAATMITGLATVATSGSYNDLSNKPTIPAADDHKVHIDDASKNTIYKLAYIDSNESGNVYLYKELSSGLYVMTDPSDASSYAGLKLCCKGSIEASAVNIDGSAVATQDWVTDRGYITGITKSMVTSALGYTPPTSNTTYSAGSGLSLSGTTINHSNSVTAVTTAGLYKVKYDAQGHITGTTAVAKADITGLGIPGSDTTYSVATTSANGLMSSADKTKLNGIAEGANNYSLPTATASVLGGVKSSTTGTTSGKDYNVQINANGTMKVNVPWTDTNTWKANSSSSEGYVSSGSGQVNKVWKTDANGNPAWRDDANTTYSAATTSADGLMSSSDKTKLNGIASGANNYTHPTSHPATMITGLATVATSGSYNDLSNKPTIPSAANNGKITINQGGVKKGEFTVNQSGNTTINLDAGGGSANEPTHLIHTSWIVTPIYKGSSRTACNTTAYTSAGVYRFYESISDELPMLDIDINAYNTTFSKNMWHSMPISKYLYDVVGSLPSGIGFELIGVSITPYYAVIPGSTASIQPVLYASTNRYTPKASANQNSGDDALWFAVPNNVGLNGVSIKLSFIMYDAS